MQPWVEFFFLLLNLVVYNADIALISTGGFEKV